MSSKNSTVAWNAAEMSLNSKDVWGHFAPMFHLVDAFAIFAITLVGGRHAILPIFSAQAALSTIGALHNHIILTFCSEQHLFVFKQFQIPAMLNQPLAYTKDNFRLQQFA